MAISPAVIERLVAGYSEVLAGVKDSECNLDHTRRLLSRFRELAILVGFFPWSVFVLSEAIVFTWIFQNTRGSVLMATLYHGSSNIGMILYGGIDPAWVAAQRERATVEA